MRRIVGAALAALVLAAALVLTAALVFALTPSARAGGPGMWTQVTGGDLSNITQVDLARTADGVLHVVWAAPYGRTSVLHRAIGSNGAMGAPTTVVQGWSTAQDPAIMLDGAGLRVFAAGIRTLNPGDDGLYTATSDVTGAVWGATAMISNAHSVYASPVRAVTAANGKTLVAWSGTSGVWVLWDTGGSRQTREYNNAQIGGTGYYPNLAADSAGLQRVWLAWWPLPDAAHDKGIWVNEIDAATGTPIGAALHLPGSSVSFNGRQESISTDTAVPLVARVGGGVYAAGPVGYPSAKWVRVWKLDEVGGAPSATSVAVASGDAAKDNVALAAAPDGRLWVLWTQRTLNGLVVHARRSNATASTWGAAVTLAVPKAAYEVYRLAAGAQAGRLDLLAHLGVGSGAGTWHTQILPGLSLQSSKKVLKAGTRYKLTFSVRDAGAPVAGASVKAGRATAKTNSAGKAVLSIGPFKPGVVKVTATAPSYAKAGMTLSVKR